MDSVSSRSFETEDHNARWYSVRVRPYKMTDNRIAGVVLVFIDMTEIRKSLESIRRLATVVRDSNDAVLVQDRKGDIRAWNPTAERLYGYSESEALSMNIHQVMPAEERDTYDQVVKRVLQGQFADPARTTRIAKDGRAIHVVLTASLLIDADGKPTGIATTEREIKDTSRA